MDRKSYISYAAGSIHTYKEGDSFVFSTNALGLGPKEKSGAAPSIGLTEIEKVQLEWASWGSNDDYPAYLKKYLSKLGVVKSSIDIVSDIRYGQGIHWFEDEYTEEGKRIAKMRRVDDWERLKREEDLELSIADTIEHLNLYSMAFPVLTFNGEFLRKPESGFIKTVALLDTYFVRFKKKDVNGFTTHIGYSSLFGERQPTKDEIQWIPIFDKDNPRKYAQYCLPLSHNTSGEVYYSEANWQAVLRAGWGDTLVSVPQLINAIYKHIMVVKNVVRIPIGFFKLKYSNWEDLTQEERIKKFQEEIEGINKTLTSTDKAGKTIVSITDSDANGESVGGIIVEPIKSFLDTAAELPNNTFGNQEFMFAAGLDPTLVGSGTKGTSNLSGSGSDKRVASNFKQGTMERRRLVEYKLARHIAMQNGYYKTNPYIYPSTIDIDVSQTLDVNPTGKSAKK